MRDRIKKLKAEILSGGPSLREMADFAERDFALEAAIRQHRAIDAAIEKGVFPVRVGNFIVKDKDTIQLSRNPPPYAPQMMEKIKEHI